MTKHSDFYVAIFHFCTNVFRAILGKKREFSTISFQQKISAFEKSRNWGKKKTGPKERNVKENMKDLSHLLMSSYKPKVGPQG
jgi:hypothetical protein